MMHGWTLSSNAVGSGMCRQPKATKLDVMQLAAQLLQELQVWTAADSPERHAWRSCLTAIRGKLGDEKTAGMASTRTSTQI